MEYDKKIENYLKFMDYIRNNGYLANTNYSKFTITYKYEKGNTVYMAMESGRLGYHYIYIGTKDHRCSYANGPALVKFDDDILQEWYYIDDELHRLDGPAYIIYKNKQIFEEHYYINGIRYDDEFKFLVARELYK